MKNYWNIVTWSTSTPRSAVSSSMARYDSRYRRYRRTATMITAGGNGTRQHQAATQPVHLPSANATVPVNCVCQLEVEHILGSPPWYRRSSQGSVPPRSFVLHGGVVFLGRVGALIASVGVGVCPGIGGAGLRVKQMLPG